jgi:hypothetical protein
MRWDGLPGWAPGGPWRSTLEGSLGMVYRSLFDSFCVRKLNLKKADDDP